MAAGGNSQAGSYGALLVGGVLLTAAVAGRSIREVLAGHSSPLRPLLGTPPAPSGGSGGSEGASANTAFQTGAGAISAGGSAAVKWAQSVLGTSGGSGAVARWDRAIGAAPGIPWCSAFVSAALREAGVSNLPADAAYSGAWLHWSGGQNLHTTNLKAAQPGDLLIFDWGDGGQTDHVALYQGHGKMISGNDGNDSVGASSVPSGNIVGIVRPLYPGTRHGEAGHSTNPANAHTVKA